MGHNRTEGVTVGKGDGRQSGEEVDGVIGIEVRVSDRRVTIKPTV